MYITGIQFLFDTINPDQLDIPQFIWDYDKQVYCYITTRAGMMKSTEVVHQY